MFPKEIYIIRHGQTDLNKQNIVQGRGIDSSINEMGVKQSQLFFKSYKHIPFNKIYASTLQRTTQTLKPFKEIGYNIDKKIELDELDWGKHEGTLHNAVTKEDFSRIITAWNAGDLSQKVDGGETPLEVQARQQFFLKELEKENAARVLICSHGRAMRILLCTMLGRELSNMDTFPHQNLCLYKLYFDGKNYTVEIENNTDHLNPRFT